MPRHTLNTHLPACLTRARRVLSLFLMCCCCALVSSSQVLIYLTLYITQCLQKLEKCPTQMEAMKALTAMAHEQFRIPGDAGFALGSFFPAPASPQEGEMCRTYLKQVREELGRRLVGKVYADGTPSKFWIVFAKKKFMNKSL